MRDSFNNVTSDDIINYYMRLSKIIIINGCNTQRSYTWEKIKKENMKHYTKFNVTSKEVERIEKYKMKQYGKNKYN